MVPDSDAGQYPNCRAYRFTSWRNFCLPDFGSGNCAMISSAFILTHFPSQRRNALYPFRIEGEKYAVPPLIRHRLTADALTASSNAIRYIGRTRLSLLRFSRKPLREVFRRFFPLPCTGRQLSGGKGFAYFFPSLCCRKILAKIMEFVKIILHFTGAAFPLRSLKLFL